MLKSIKGFLVLLSLVLIIFTACKENTKTANKHVDTSRAKTVTGNITPADTTLKSIESVSISELPFGSKTLRTYKFPQTIATADLVDSIDAPKNEHEKHFENMEQEHGKLDDGRSFKGPEIVNKSYTYLGEDSLIIADSRHFENDFKYRLPDVNKYECYYIYHNYMTGDYTDYKNSPIQTKDKKCFLQIGSLVLYDRQTKSANVINVEYLFDTGADDFTSYGRYFYVDKDKKIKIFDCTTEEGSISFDGKKEISVLEDGKIVVKNIH